MILDHRSLLLGGLGVFMSSGGMALVINHRENIGYLFSKNIHPSIYKLGMECRGLGEVGCSIYPKRKMVVRKGEDSTFSIDSLVGGGRIRVYRDDDYLQGLKFVIEDNDIGTPDGNKLEERETYQVVSKKGKYYFSRKRDSREEIKASLGLSCDLPSQNDTPKDCDISEKKIKGINFEGGGVTPNGSPKLKIIKEEHRHIYPLGYRFSFSSENGDSSLTIGEETINLKKNMEIDFLIKRKGDQLALEKAWTPDSLMGKANLVKKGDHWTIGSEAMKIKQDNKKSSKVIALAGGSEGKIRVYGGDQEYNQGYKFVVEEGDMKFESNDANIERLSKYETYEVIYQEEWWYFSRKKKASEIIQELLNLPKGCLIPEGSPEVQCDLDAAGLNGIKFEGRGSGSINVEDSNYSNLKLKITKTNDSNDVYGGYKFTLVSDKTITIPLSSGDLISINRDTNTEFKIKKSGSKLTLEKAWTPKSLGERMNLSCGENKECNFGNTISVFEGDGNYVNDALISSANSSAKISYIEGALGYNQGIKFFLEEDVGLVAGSSGGAGVSKLKRKNGGSVSYQILEKTVGGKSKWYLVKK